MTKQELIDYIGMVAPGYGLNPALCVRQCAAESSLNVEVRDSHAGAVGVMQLMPIAITDLEKRWGMIVDPRDPKQAVRGGLTLMQWLKEHYHGDMRKAYAGYNWGAGALDGIIRRCGAAWEQHVPGETRAYVAKICGPPPGVAAELPKAA